MLLSIVAVRSSASEDVERCLRSVFAFCSSDIEVILVSSLPVYRRKVPGLTVIERAGADVATLRGLGAARASGEILAFLDVSCRICPGWETSVRRGLEEAPAVTGPVSYGGGRLPATWGAFLAEYGGLLPGIITQGEVAGCNLAFRRSMYFELFESGEPVYKPELVARMQRLGAEIIVIDDALVSHRRPVRFSSFLRDRFEQGRDYARYRAIRASLPERLRRALAFPLTWLVLTARLAVSFMAPPRPTPAFLVGVPVAACYLFFWSLGEARGYLEK